MSYPGKSVLAMLVDRIWPRGISNRALGHVEHLRELAPSTELRIWIGHGESHWQESKKRYKQELQGHSETLSH